MLYRSRSTVLLQQIPQHGWVLHLDLLLRRHWLQDQEFLDLLLDAAPSQLVLPAQLQELEALVLVSQAFHHPEVLEDRRLVLEARQEVHQAFPDVEVHQEAHVRFPNPF